MMKEGEEWEWDDEGGRGVGYKSTNQSSLVVPDAIQYFRCKRYV